MVGGAQERAQGWVALGLGDMGLEGGGHESSQWGSASQPPTQATLTGSPSLLPGQHPPLTALCLHTHTHPFRFLLTLLRVQPGVGPAPFQKEPERVKPASPQHSTTCHPHTPELGTVGRHSRSSGERAPPENPGARPCTGRSTWWGGPCDQRNPHPTPPVLPCDSTVRSGVPGRNARVPLFYTHRTPGGTSRVPPSPD